MVPALHLVRSRLSLAVLYIQPATSLKQYNCVRYSSVSARLRSTSYVCRAVYCVLTACSVQCGVACIPAVRRVFTNTIVNHRHRPPTDASTVHQTEHRIRNRTRNTPRHSVRGGHQVKKIAGDCTQLLWVLDYRYRYSTGTALHEHVVGITIDP